MTKRTSWVTVKVVERIAGNGDDVGQQPLGEPAAVGDLDEFGRHDGGRPQHGRIRHPAVDERDEFAAFLPCGIAGASVPTAILTPAS